MEPLDKLEIILKGMINKRDKEIERGQGEGIQLSGVYLNGIEHEKSGLELALAELRAIRKNAPSISDEIVQKMFGPVPKS